MISQLLHTATRRFSIDAYSKWVNHYFHSGASDRPSSDESHDIFPRYLVHTAILRALEQTAPDDLPGDESQTRALLVRAIANAHDPMTLNLTNPISLRAMADERRKSIDFVKSLTPADLSAVEPLPYRRVLQKDESDRLLQRAQNAFGIDRGYWYPLVDTFRTDVAAFASPEFFRDLGEEWLREVLQDHGVSHCFELRELDIEPDYELELAAAEFRYNGSEGFWFDKEYDWVVYSSHETSITLGGEWLVAAAKQAWPDWQANLWAVSA